MILIEDVWDFIDAIEYDVFQPSHPERLYLKPVILRPDVGRRTSRDACNLNAAGAAFSGELE